MTLFDMEPTAKPAPKVVGPMPGDTVQDDLFGAPVILKRKHEAKAPVEVVDVTPVMFATDEREWDGQEVATDIFGGMA